MRRLGDGYLGTDHVLLGILSVEGGTAVRILAFVVLQRTWIVCSSGAGARPASGRSRLEAVPLGGR